MADARHPRNEKRRNRIGEHSKIAIALKKGISEPLRALLPNILVWNIRRLWKKNLQH